MRLGRAQISGPRAWPDQLLEAGAVAGVVLAVWRLAFGAEVRRSAFGGRSVWMNVYLGFWAFEIYFGGEFE